MIYAILILAVSLLSAQTAASNPTRTWSDPATGVTFQYPDGWRLNDRPAPYLQPAILPQDVKADADVWFEPAGRFADTDLSGAEFIYRAVPESGRDACYSRSRIEGDQNAKPDLMNINGVSYLHRRGGQAGLCHQEEENAWALYQDGRCLLFETAIHRMCEGAPGKRDLKPAEWRQISGWLDEIVRSIRVQTK